MHWLVLLFGLISALWILESFHKKKCFDEKALTKIGTAYLIASLSILFLFKSSLLLQVLLNGFILFGMTYFPLFTVFSGESELRRSVEEKVRMILLFMKLGQSFRSGFQSVIQSENNPRIKTQLTKMYRIVTFPQQNRANFYLSELNQLTNDLKFVDQLEFGAVQNLQYISSHQKILSDFRRKSGTVKSQIWLQACLLTVLIVAVAVFMSLSFGFQQVSQFILVAMFLVGLGHGVALKMGNRIRWRI